MAFRAGRCQPTIPPDSEEAMTLFRRALCLTLLAATLAGLAACSNTIRGIGRDVHQTGRAIEDAANGR
jgi:predicted small secreted protein